MQAPHRGEKVCGDAWGVVSFDRFTTILVADGLGHGAFAAKASNEAVRFFKEHAEMDPAALLDGVHQALRSTRGAAVAVARVEPENGRVRYAGIGNIAGLIVSGADTQQMVSHNGTAGHQVRRIQEFNYSWRRGSVLVMHSDGLGSRWSLRSYPGLQMRDPAVIAGVLYRDHNRGRDDVSVVVWKDA
jgi:serine phosphatase RsbU (regulator of sigma subunit)